MHFDLQPVPKARNLDRIGWANGYVLVQFKGRPDRYVFGPKIGEDVVPKILANPFPDRLFQLTVKQKFQCAKLGK